MCRSILPPFRSLVAESAYFLLFATGVATGAVLDPGAELTDCRSALRPGPTDCPIQPPVPVEQPAQTTQTAHIPGSAEGVEEQVDAFLAAYGKPPREAVRALLDPSDVHIRAMLQKQQETLAVAAYVASRLSAMQQQVRGAPEAASEQAEDLPDFLQMRVTLVQRPRDPESRAVLQALRALVLRVPALQAQVALVGVFDAQRLRAELVQIDAPLAVAVAGPQTLEGRETPFLQIEDLRNRRSQIIDARDLRDMDVAQLRLAIVSLRRVSDAEAAAVARPVPAPWGESAGPR